MLMSRDFLDEDFLDKPSSNLLLVLPGSQLVMGIPYEESRENQQNTANTFLSSALLGTAGLGRTSHSFYTQTENRETWLCVYAAIK